MSTRKVTFYVRPKVYRGDEGFHIGSRGNGRTGIYGLSIFVKDRAGAERIRDAYKACEAGFITRDEVDAHVDEVFDAEIARRAA